MELILCKCKCSKYYSRPFQYIELACALARSRYITEERTASLPLFYPTLQLAGSILYRCYKGNVNGHIVHIVNKWLLELATSSMHRCHSCTPDAALSGAVFPVAFRYATFSGSGGGVSGAGKAG